MLGQPSRRTTVTSRGERGNCNAHQPLEESVGGRGPANRRINGELQPKGWGRALNVGVYIPKTKEGEASGKGSCEGVIREKRKRYK